MICSCAVSPTFGEKDLRDFNQDFERDNPIKPKYRVEPIADNIFLITAHQGSILISEGDTRWGLLKQAAETVGHGFCKKLNATPTFYEGKKMGDSGWVHLTAKFACVPVTEPRQEKKDSGAGSSEILI